MESALYSLIKRLEKIDQAALKQGSLTAEQSALVIKWFCARSSATNLEDARGRRITRAGNRYDEKNRIINEIKALCGV